MDRNSETTYLPDFLTIPCVLIRDKNLQPLDYLVYGVVYWYSKMKLEKCVASNRAIATILSSKQGSVANAISRLAKAGYVRILLDDSTPGKNKVRKEIIPLIAFTDPSSNNEGGFHQIMKGVSSNDEGGVSSNDEENNNIYKKEDILFSPASQVREGSPTLSNEDTPKQGRPRPHNNKLQAKPYSNRDWLLEMTADDVAWYQEDKRFPACSNEFIRRHAQKAYYWLEGKGRTQKDYRAFLYNWIDNVLERSQTKTKRGVTIEQ